MIANEEPLCTTDVVVMELLAGARDDARRDNLRRPLYRCPLLPVRGLADFAWPPISTERTGEGARRCAS